MPNEQKQIPKVAVPLPKGKKNLVQLGCLLMMLSVSMFGLVFATLTSPILESIDAMGYVGLFTIFAALGVTIMTPVGGKLGELLGYRNIIVIPGIICVISGILFAFAHSLFPLLLFRLIIGLAQGAFTAAPYVIAGQINEQKDVPKAFGMFTTTIAIGGFGGSILAGFLTDMGLLQVAILMPVVPMIIGILLIGLNMPNIKRPGKVKFDIPGLILLVISISGILLSLNFGSSKGWTSPIILCGFAVGIIAVIAFIKLESKIADPLIPIRLFKNKAFSAIVLASFLCYIYINAMNVYAPMVAIRALSAKVAIAGSFQMPRTIISILLPTVVGVWVGKKTQNLWKSMIIACVAEVVAMGTMAFTTPSTTLVIFFIGIAITAIADSCRSVAYTPCAQALLEPKDLGYGTALISFTNSLAPAVAAAVNGAMYNIYTIADPNNATNVINGCNAVFRISAVIPFVCIFIVFFLIRPSVNKLAQEKQKAAARN